jgi:addiction module RelE/StbE family toxin
MRIVWTRKALRHLADIRTYIEQDKPEAARKVAASILRTVAYLAQHPHLGRPGRKPGTRELVIADTPYLVPYQVRDDRLIILAVLHGAQRPPEG